MCDQFPMTSVGPVALQESAVIQASLDMGEKRPCEPEGVEEEKNPAVVKQEGAPIEKKPKDNFDQKQRFSKLKWIALMDGGLFMLYTVVMTLLYITAYPVGLNNRARGWASSLVSSFFYTLEFVAYFANLHAQIPSVFAKANRMRELRILSFALYVSAVLGFLDSVRSSFEAFSFFAVCLGFIVLACLYYHIFAFSIERRVNIFSGWRNFLPTWLVTIPHSFSVTIMTMVYFFNPRLGESILLLGSLYVLIAVLILWARVKVYREMDNIVYVHFTCMSAFFARTLASTVPRIYRGIRSFPLATLAGVSVTKFLYFVFKVLTIKLAEGTRVEDKQRLLPVLFTLQFGEEIVTSILFLDSKLSLAFAASVFVLTSLQLLRDSGYVQEFIARKIKGYNKPLKLARYMLNEYRETEQEIIAEILAAPAIVVMVLTEHIATSSFVDPSKTTSRISHESIADVCQVYSILIVVKLLSGFLGLRIFTQRVRLLQAEVLDEAGKDQIEEFKRDILREVMYHRRGKDDITSPQTRRGIYGRQSSSGRNIGRCNTPEGGNSCTVEKSCLSKQSDEKSDVQRVNEEDKTTEAASDSFTSPVYRSRSAQQTDFNWSVSLPKLPSGPEVFKRSFGRPATAHDRVLIKSVLERSKIHWNENRFVLFLGAMVGINSIRHYLNEFGGREYS